MALTKENEYVTLPEAAKRSRYSKRQIQKLAESGVERIRTKKLDNGYKLFNLKDIIQYSSAHPEKMILNPVWDEINYIEGECFYPLFGYDHKIFITSKGRVINATNGQVLTPQKKDKDGYSQIKLMKCGKSKSEYLHRLIALTQCPNVLQKEIVHHIKIHNPSIDKSSNLLWVWKSQHDELHRLLRDNKTEEYKKMVNEIKKENRQKLYKIPHPDFANDENFTYWLWLNKCGYQAYKSQEEIPYRCIVRECAERRGN